MNDAEAFVDVLLVAHIAIDAFQECEVEVVRLREALAGCAFFLSEGDYTTTTRFGYDEAARLVAVARALLGEGN